MDKSSNKSLASLRPDFLSQKKIRVKRGDTLVEIMFAVGIFGLVAIGAIGIMNKGMYDAQKALEISMARNEIDAQAESLRFLHSAYIAEKNFTTKTYTSLWTALTDPNFTYNSRTSTSARVLPDDFFSAYTAENSCETIYKSGALPDRSFVLNTRRLDNSIVKKAATTTSVCTRGSAENCIILNSQNFETSPVYPRILYTDSSSQNFETTDSLSDTTVTNTNATATTSIRNNILNAQGLWVTAVASDASSNPEYYDFYIRTCWYGPGASTPTTISTTVRLFNPDSAPVSLF
ncbi:type II secretion system protein [Candidatus Saccharibacteria bacterium]|nr:type II secretion system protein [Candidatus Saccharibacteria bacterium]